MRADSTTTASKQTIAVRQGVVALSGYGLSVRVEHGRLCLKDGIGARRREARFSKATSGIKRLAVLGHSGVVTLEALRWLRDIKAAVIQIDADGNVILASTPPNQIYSSLRRNQALAHGTETGLYIARRLLERKLDSEAHIAELLGAAEVAQRIRVLADGLGVATDGGGLRQIEAQAASLYWSKWSSVPLSFARRDAANVPDHWLTFGSRASPISGASRNAANPANALLNYLYAILEGETRIALLTVGLDPALGVLHADLPSRDSLVYDVMEVVRPHVDAWLLDFLRHTDFSARHFFERRDGVVRVTSSLTPTLAETSLTWARAVAPVAEWVAGELYRAGMQDKAHRSLPKALPTPLTGKNRSAGRRVALGREPKPRSKRSVPQPKTCLECGALLTNTERRFCSGRCREAYNEAVVIPRLSTVGVAALAELRDTGHDPAHGGEAARKRGMSNTRRMQQRKEWEAVHPDVAAEKRRFKKEILPRLAAVSLTAIRRATGMSPRYASMIRRGLYVPHPMHYEALRKLIGLTP